MCEQCEQCEQCRQSGAVISIWQLVGDRETQSHFFWIQIREMTSQKVEGVEMIKLLKSDCGGGPIWFTHNIFQN